MNQVPVLRCSAVEMAVMASLIGVDSLLGLPDPFRRKLGDQVAEECAAARTALQQRGLLRSELGAPIVEDSVASAMAACGFPDASFVLTWAAPGARPRVRYFHKKAGVVYELVIQPDADPACTLYRYGDAGDALASVDSFLQLESPRSMGIADGTMSEAALMQVKTVLAEKGRAEAVRLLQAEGVEADTALQLVDTFAHAIGNGSLSAFAAQAGSFDVDGFGFLVGLNGIWMLRPVSTQGASQVAISSCSARMLLDQIGQLLRRMAAGTPT